MAKLLDTGPSPRGWHRLQVMLQCPQKWGYHYELGLGGKKDSPPLIRGSLIHLGLAHHYSRMKARQQGTDPEEWLKPLTAMREKAFKENDAWMRELEVSTNCYEAYIEHWADETIEILEVERLAYTMIGRNAFTGRFDLVYRDRRGKIWVCDHKTTGRIQSSQKKFYSISGQLAGYAYLGRQLYGDKFGGMILNLVQHTKPCKFVRMPLPPAPHLVSKFPQIVLDAEERIKSLKESGRSPDNWPMAANELTCYSRYGPCNYLDNCRWGMKK